MQKRKLLGVALSAAMAVSAVAPWTGLTVFAEGEQPSQDDTVVSQLPLGGGVSDTSEKDTTNPPETNQLPTEETETPPEVEQLPAEPSEEETIPLTPVESVENSDLEPETVEIDITEPEPPEETCEVEYKETSPGVTYDVNGDVITITIGEDAPESDLVINLSDVTMENLSGFIGPGASWRFHVNVINKSGRPYQYKDGSFVLSTAKATEFGEKSYYLGYDGQRIPVKFISNVYVELDPIKELFGVSKGEQISLDDMFELYDYLADKGFTGETAFTDYMLDWFNEDFGTQCGTWDELVHENIKGLQKEYGKPGINSIWSDVSKEELAALMEKYPDSVMASNLHLTEKADGTYDVQFYWPEEDLATFMYNVFYQDILSGAYGEEVDQMDPSSKGNDFTKTRGVGDYMPGTELYAQTNDYFAALTNEAMSSETGASFDMVFCLDGPDMGNTYQYYDFSWYNVIELEQPSTTVDPDPDPDPDPYIPYIPDPDPDPEEPVEPTEPDEEIEEPDVPLANLPDTSEDAIPAGSGEEEIDDEDTPLVDAPPQTGAKAAGSAALLAGAAAVAVITLRKKHK